MDISKVLKAYPARLEQEVSDVKIMQDFIQMCSGDVWTRDNAIAHMTASSMIFNQDYSKVLMAYHKIYDSWAWTGGHADGNQNLLEVAIKEAMEETGIETVTAIVEYPVAVDILQVKGHMKRGKYVSPHLHFNLTYLLAADENEMIQNKPDENLAVAWWPVDEVLDVVKEEHMKPVYEKIFEYSKAYFASCEDKEREDM